MAAELQAINFEQILAQWAAAQGEDWSADPHCSFCQQSNQDWYNHWRSGAVLNICHGCFNALAFMKCAVCLGVGTAYDMTANNYHQKLCPNCRRRQPAYGLQ